MKKSKKAKDKITYGRKAKSKLSIQKRRTGAKEKAKKVRDLTEKEHIQLDKILRKIEKAELYDGGWNRIETGFAKATPVGYDMDTIDVILTYGIKSGSPSDINVRRLQIDRRTLEVISRERMESGGYTKTEGKYQINVHGKLPEDYKIICRILRIDGKDTQVCYHERNDGTQKGVEVYSGANYIVGSTDRSHSRNFDIEEVPAKYKIIVDELKGEHHKRWGGKGSMAQGGKTTYAIGNVFKDKTGTISRIEDVSGNLVKDILYDGKRWRYNPVYKTYNSTSGNIILWNPDRKKIKVASLVEMEEDDSMASGGKTSSSGSTMASGGFVSKGEMVWNKLTSSKRAEFLYENFTPEITPRSQEILVGKAYNFLPKNVKIKIEAKYANVEEGQYSSGGSTAGGSGATTPKNLVGQLKEKYGDYIKDMGITEIFIDPYGDFRMTSDYDVDPSWAEAIEKDARELSGSMARGGKAAQRKMGKVMREFKEGKLRSGSGKKVTDRDQAIAIGLSESGQSRKQYNKGGNVEAGNILIKLGVIEQKLNNKGVFLKDFDENNIGANATFEGHEIDEYNYEDENGNTHTLPEDVQKLIDQYNDLSMEFYEAIEKK